MSNADRSGLPLYEENKKSKRDRIGEFLDRHGPTIFYVEVALLAGALVVRPKVNAALANYRAMQNNAAMSAAYSREAFDISRDVLTLLEEQGYTRAQIPAAS